VCVNGASFNTNFHRCSRFFNTSTQQLFKKLRDSLRLNVEQFEQWFEQTTTAFEQLRFSLENFRISINPEMPEYVL